MVAFTARALMVSSDFSQEILNEKASLLEAIRTASTSNSHWIVTSVRQGRTA
jgi:hypothetical protein